MDTSTAPGQHSTPKEIEFASECFLLDLEQVEHYWPQIETYLDEAPELWDRWYTKETLRARAEGQHLQVWVICSEKGGVIDSVFFSQVLPFDAGRAFHIFWIWGRDALRALKCAALATNRFAEQAGCNEILITGRMGWMRPLREVGGKSISLTMSRPVYRTKEH